MSNVIHLADRAFREAFDAPLEPTEHLECPTCGEWSPIEDADDFEADMDSFTCEYHGRFRRWETEPEGAA